MIVLHILCFWSNHCLSQSLYLSFPPVLNVSSYFFLFHWVIYFLFLIFLFFFFSFWNLDGFLYVAKISHIVLSAFCNLEAYSLHIGTAWKFRQLMSSEYPSTAEDRHPWIIATASLSSGGTFYTVAQMVPSKTEPTGISSSLTILHWHFSVLYPTFSLLSLLLPVITSPVNYPYTRPYPWFCFQGHPNPNTSSIPRLSWYFS